MKNALFIILVSLFASYAQAQDYSVEKDDYMGYWTSDGTTAEIIIWKDINGNFQIVQFNTDDGEVCEILDIHFEGNSLSVRTRFKSTNHVITSKYNLSNEFLMECKIAGDSNTIIEYKKLK